MTTALQRWISPRRALPAALLALLLAPAPAQAAYRWVPAELDRTVRFSGESKDCRVGPDIERFSLQRPATAVQIRSPDPGQRVHTDRDYAQVFYRRLRSGDDPGEVELEVGVGGKPWVCPGGTARWESAPVRIHVEYLQGIYTPDTPAVPPPPPPLVTPLRRYCGNYGATVRSLRSLRTTCFSARVIVRRYLGTARTLRVHRVFPYTCFDHVVVGAREVTCRASGGRYLWFRRSLTALRR